MIDRYNKKEARKQRGKIAMFLYYTGSMNLYYNPGSQWYGVFRKWHPFSIILFIIIYAMAFIEGGIKEMKRAIFEISRCNEKEKYSKMYKDAPNTERELNNVKN